MRKHWYFITNWECYTCFNGKQSRERRYTRKPQDPLKRYEWRRYQCDHCYWS